MKVLIVARTNMTERVCIGAVGAGGESLRLMVEDGQNQPADCLYRIGDVWNLRTSPPSRITPPHVEDVIAQPLAREGTCSDVAGKLRQMRSEGLITNWWRGPIGNVFDGRTRSTQTNFSRFVSHATQLPTCSVGFWEPHADLELESDGDRHAYRFETPGEFARIAYTGQATPSPVIPSNALVRLSLSRDWAPPGGKSAFWMQLSGWYANQP